MELQAKVVVVTGAGSGMGRELALELTRRFEAEAFIEKPKVKITGTATLKILDLLI